MVSPTECTSPVTSNDFAMGIFNAKRSVEPSMAKWALNNDLGTMIVFLFTIKVKIFNHKVHKD
jgi:hypothetical protein